MIGNQASPRKEKGYQMVRLDIEPKIRPLTLSPLLQAAKNGDLEALRECFDKGDDILELSQSKASVLHYAVDNVNFDDAFDCTQEILARAALHDNGADTLSKLINLEDTLQQTALVWAAGRGNDKVIQLLLDRGSKLSVTEYNETVFYLIAKLENHEQAITCTEIFLDAKYYYNDSNKLHEYLNIPQSPNSRTALHMAAISGNHDLMQLLICNGADASKVDYVDCNVLHHAVGNAYEEKAFICTKTLLQDNLIEGWDEIKYKLLNSFHVKGKLPVHIAARRGFHRILALMSDCYLIQEANTGFTPLHAAASLGNPSKAEECVDIILKHTDSSQRARLLDLKDADGCTALYLSAKHKNMEACQLLLLAGSSFDIKTARGKTPLEKVYEKVPQAIDVLLEKAIESSGYVAFLGAINTTVELNYGPILGFSTSNENIFKETEELAKICYAKFEDRKKILDHILIRLFIHSKWEMVKNFFRIFRILHILWFLFNCFFLVTTYRVECPYKEANAKAYSWTRLRPAGDEELNVTKSLAECEVSSWLQAGGILNLIAVFVYILSQFLHTKQQIHWFFRPMKKLKQEASCMKKFQKTISYYAFTFSKILPCWPILLATGIIITTLPTLGVVIFDETYHYMIAGLMGLLIWLGIYLELGKFPKFRVYINLLMRSTRTLLLAIAVTAPILFGFATVFTILIPGEPSFSSAAQSFVKVITFMIGEIDYQGLFYGEKENVFLGIVMLSLAVFIVIIVVLLVNFLIGLAAEEIQNFWERAEIWKLCTQLEQIVEMESFLDKSVPVCGKKYLRKSLMLMPPEKVEGELIQRRRVRIHIPCLPKEMQKEIHQLNLNTIQEVK